MAPPPPQKVELREGATEGGRKGAWQLLCLPGARGKGPGLTGFALSTLSPVASPPPPPPTSPLLRLEP